MINMNTNQKRQQFVKDLDKLVSGDYVLAPKVPNEKQKRTAMFVIAQNGNAIDAYKAMLADLEVSTEEDNQV